MKELSIEEKAKRYDEAIIRGSRLWESDMITRENYEYIFPELKESEDDEIRKSIIAIITNYVDNSNTFKPKMIAWLEKQSEQKLADTEKGTNGNEREIPNLEPPLTIKHAKEVMGIKQDDAWSEEDKNMVRFIGNAITADDSSVYLKSKGIEVIDAHVWLDELKDRVLPQPKQEWSKEDKVMLDEIIDFFENGTVKLQHDLSLYASWLKSLRPQSTWKPSEEMLEALYKAIPENVMAISEDEMLLDKLYQGLKYGRVLSKN